MPSFPRSFVPFFSPFRASRVVLCTSPCFLFRGFVGLRVGVLCAPVGDFAFGCRCRPAMCVLRLRLVTSPSPPLIPPSLHVPAPAPSTSFPRLTPPRFFCPRYVPVLLRVPYSRSCSCSWGALVFVFSGMRDALTCVVLHCARPSFAGSLGNLVKRRASALRRQTNDVSQTAFGRSRSYWGTH